MRMASRSAILLLREGDGITITLVRHTACQTCAGCAARGPAACPTARCDALPPHRGDAAASSAPFQMVRDRGGAVIAVVALATLELAAHLVKGAAHVATNVSLGASLGGVRGALAAGSMGIFWTGVALLRFGVTTTVAAGAAAYTAVTALWAPSTAAPGLEPELQDAPPEAPQLADAGSQTDPVVLLHGRHGRVRAIPQVPVTVFPDLSRSMYAEAALDSHHPQTPAEPSAPPEPVFTGNNAAGSAHAAQPSSEPWVPAQPSAPPLVPMPSR
jgi:hypothetical protein